MDKKYILLNIAQYDFKSNNFYVYELINPVTQQPFYVGKGRENRAWKHILMRHNKKLWKSNPHKFHTINKIIDKERCQVIVKLVSSHKTESNAFLAEQKLVAKYGRCSNKSGILTNILAGGEGYTQDGKIVCQYTMWGDLIREYKNAKEAALQNGWKHYSVICGCCRHRERSYKGFLWAYKGQQPQLLKKKKPIYQWTLSRKFVAVYSSIAEAARSIPCDPSTINDSIRYYNNKAVGFLWTKTNQPPL